MVELDPERPTGRTDRHRFVEPPVLDPVLVEQPESGSGEVAELGVVALSLQFCDDHDGDDHLVLVESFDSVGIGEQNARVEHIGADRGRGRVRVVVLRSTGVRRFGVGHLRAAAGASGVLARTRARVGLRSSHVRSPSGRQRAPSARPCLKRWTGNGPEDRVPALSQADAGQHVY